MNRASGFVGPVVVGLTLALSVVVPPGGHGAAGEAKGTLNDQLAQHSGTKPPAALKASVDEPKRLAGKLSFDNTASLGPKVDVEFDATLVKEFKAAR